MKNLQATLEKLPSVTEQAQNSNKTETSVGVRSVTEKKENKEKKQQTERQDNAVMTFKQGEMNDVEDFKF